MDCDNCTLSTAICRSELLIPLSNKPPALFLWLLIFFTLLIFQEQILKPTILLSYTLLKDTIEIKSCQSQIFSAGFTDFFLNTEWMMENTDG